MKPHDPQPPPTGLVFDQRYPDLGRWLRRSSLQDLVSARGHSGDFCSSRAEYIYMRVRLLAFAFAVLALLWVPIDLLVLDPEVLWPILGLRVGFSGLFLLLGLWLGQPHSLHTAWLRMAAVITIPAAFYVCSRSLLGGGLPEQGVMVGYSFLPYLMVSLMAIFPLTLAEGLAYAAVMTLAVVGTELAHGNLFTLNALGEVWLLVLLAGIAIWVQLAQLHMLLRLYREATRDSLTGLINRRALTHALEVELVTAEQQGRPLSVLLFDLDLFKRINDQYGHLIGDAVLQAFARILESKSPDPDLIGRYGGEEFLAVLPDTDMEQAQEVAERIRAACHEASIRIEGGLVHFTTSIGVTQWRPGETATTLLNRLDQGLYQAKESGRDLVAAAG